MKNISIHAARMGCDGEIVFSVSLIKISIHAARMGCDYAEIETLEGTHNFNPRSPNGLRHFLSFIKANSGHFNPRSPNGLRQLRPFSFYIL